MNLTTTSRSSATFLYRIPIKNEGVVAQTLTRVLLPNNTEMKKNPEIEPSAELLGKRRFSQSSIESDDIDNFKINEIMNFDYNKHV